MYTFQLQELRKLTFLAVLAPKRKEQTGAGAQRPQRAERKPAEGEPRSEGGHRGSQVPVKAAVFLELFASIVHCSKSKPT